MSKTVINKREQFKWDSGFNPSGETLPTKATTDAGKVLGVQDNGEWGLLEPSEGAIYTAGDNIQISDSNVISATDTTYTAGDYINISEQKQISVSKPIIQSNATDGGYVLNKVVIGGVTYNLKGYIYTGTIDLSETRTDGYVFLGQFSGDKQLELSCIVYANTYVSQLPDSEFQSWISSAESSVVEKVVNSPNGLRIYINSAYTSGELKYVIKMSRATLL